VKVGKRRRLNRAKRRKGWGSSAAVRCYYCKTSFNDRDPQSQYYPTRDHKVPKSMGGAGTRDNIVWSCRGCNQAKGARTAAEYRAEISVF
jgi:5-methylcytosine-specific restriction endonuclease McrA